MADKERKLPITCYDIEEETFYEIFIFDDIRVNEINKINEITKVEVGKVLYNDHLKILYIYQDKELIQYHFKHDLPGFEECDRKLLPRLA